MKKRVANRGVWLWVLAGAVVVAGFGCSDLTNYVDKNEAGVKDGGKTDGKGGASGSSSSRKDGGVAGKSGSGGSGSSSSSGGEIGGVGGNSQMGGQSGSSSSSDAGVDAPVGGTAGVASSAVGGSGGASVMSSSGGSSTPPSSGGSSTPASSGGSGGSSSRDAGVADRPTDPTLCTTAATCQAPTGGNGSAVCQGGKCGISCNLGYHLCGNSCLPDTSPDSCGSSCAPCGKPASNGSATCSGTPLACGIRCDLGFHVCGSSCVVNGSTSTSSCGNTCAPCTAPANGTVTCNGRSCVQACNSGYHLCNGACIPNNSVDGCGTASCTPCRVPANGSPTCNGTSCGFECNSNYHKCGNNCASNTDPNNCGSGCKVCPGGDLNGTPACVAGECAINCKTGFHWCANIGRCVANNSTWPGSCGNGCTVCPTATGAVATCDGSKCGLEYSSCPDDLALCGTDCVAQDNKHCGPTCKDCTGLTAPTDTHMVCESNACVAKCNGTMINCAPEGATPLCVSPSSTSLDHCGGSCTACPDPGTLGSRTCSGTPLKCGIECGSTAHLCGTTCKLKTDAEACGVDCTACSTTVLNAIPACLSEQCGFECASGYHRCDKDEADPCKKNDNAEFCGADCTKCDTDWTCKEGTCTAPVSPPPVTPDPNTPGPV